MSIRKGDSIIIIAGKDRSKTGIIERVLPKSGTVIVQGLHMFKKHQKPSKNYPHGGIVDISMPMQISNVSLICSHCKKATRVTMNLTDSVKKRVCRKCGETI